MMRILQKLRRRLDGDDGFTLVEAMVSITILAVGAFTIAQAMIFGLGSTGLSRQRLASRAALDQQMEQARALNYDNLVLSDATNLTHSTDPNNPDYYVNQVAQTYDPDGAGSMAAEPLVRVAGASPALQHYQNPYTNGGTTYEVYRYVTWYDSPQDGTGAGDAADGNRNGVSDANGHDAKRVTVVVVWTNNVTSQRSTLSESSLFSDGQITYHAPAANAAPTVSCPDQLDQRTTRSHSPPWRRTRTARSRACRGTSATARPDRERPSRIRTRRTGPTRSSTRSSTTAERPRTTARRHATSRRPTRPRERRNGWHRRGQRERHLHELDDRHAHARQERCYSEPGDDEVLERQLYVARPVRVGDLVHMDDPQRRRNEDRLCRYFDSSGQYGAIASDTITLDTIAPGHPRIPQGELIDSGFDHHRRTSGGPLRSASPTSGGIGCTSA